MIRQPIRDVAGLVDRLDFERPLALELPAAPPSLSALLLPSLKRQRCMRPPPGVPPAGESCGLPDASEAICRDLIAWQLLVGYRLEGGGAGGQSCYVLVSC